ncbi:ABC transporter transmembrane domain-containing protein [Mycobacterium haemophilum]|nr:ABC transporter ATP-binding protein [Mycobacterium haemophilum]
MVSNALMPMAIGMVIDSLFGATPVKEPAAQSQAWLLLLALGIVQTVTNVGRHRCSNENARLASFRTIQIVIEHVADVGAAMRSIASNDAATIGAVDIANIGEVMMVTGRATGAFISFLVVGLIAIHISVPLGIAVIIGVPVVATAVTPLLGHLHRHQTELRETVGSLGVLAMDLAHGLRVIRGIRAEEEFAARYQAESKQAQCAGTRLGQVEARLDAAKSVLPGALIVCAIWLGAHLVVVGSVSAGELVTLYGFAVFMSTLLYTATEFADKVSRGLVSAQRVIRILNVNREPALMGGSQRLPAAVPSIELLDRASGLQVRMGALTVVVSSTSSESHRLAAILGRFTAGDVLFRGLSADLLRLDEYRRAVLVVEANSLLFAGRLRDDLDPAGQHTRVQIESALQAACADDIVDALPNGLDSSIGARGYTLSGGQRQRLVLARALLAEPEILVLVEPTRALDPRTQVTLVRRLASYRKSRTTIIISENPVVLGVADRVVVITENLVRADGTPREFVTVDAQLRLA